MDWKQILDAVDDDYLVGISNKGIVKRAYKDKEEAGAKGVVEEGDTELTVEVGEETVKICLPLGESKCSCPSRSICRHVVLGILLAKEQVGKQMTDTSKPEEIEGNEPEAGVQNLSEPSNEGLAVVSSQETISLQSQLLEEIKTYPLKPLLRALGTKPLRSLVEKMKAQVVPEIQQTSIVTVKLPEQEIVVKLLSPLEYSTCTCHKKEMCSHKAEAILWCQWTEKVITTESLAGEAEQTPEFDREHIKEASLQMKEYLEELLHMGLCRTSMEVVNTLERLAILAHNAELPRLENSLRALADTYGRYLRRSASFSVNDGLRRVSRLYGQILRLLKAESNSEISKLAGEFHAEYKLVGDLDLVGITREHFISQSGYEGDTVYFLEEHTGKWYTYTNARPTFYEGKKRSAYTEKAQAPWGLSIPLEGMVNMKIHLQGAKCDASGRLSSSQEIKGELVSGRDLSKELLKGWYYEDFGVAFAEQIAVEGEEERTIKVQPEKLVLLNPAEVEAAKFDEVEQVLCMPLWDAGGRKILVEIPYSKKGDATIRYLERMKEGTAPCFVGRLYLKESRLQMYPLDLFTKRELPWSGEAEKKLFGFISAKIEKKEEINVGPQEAVLTILEEVEAVLGDLYQVGFDTVQESVLRSLKELGELAETYGLEYLSKQLLELAEQIIMERHCMQKTKEAEEGGIIGRFMELCEYIYIGQKKVMYDKAERYYRNEEE